MIRLAGTSRGVFNIRNRALSSSFKDMVISTGSSNGYKSGTKDPVSGLEYLRVAIIGRPNVGKSTLFNRLTGRKSAIVSPVPGTTRDRKEGKATLSGLTFELIDTGGLDNRGAISADIRNQIELALEKCHVALFLLDGKVGVTPVDDEYMTWLRKIYMNTYVKPLPGDDKIVDLDNDYNMSHPKDIIILANKTEGTLLEHQNTKLLDTLADAYRWGAGDPISISATHGDGMVDLFHNLYDIAKKRGFDTGESTKKAKINSRVEVNIGGDGLVVSSGSSSNTGLSKQKTPISVEERVIQLAIMGKPNVGKSTLMNAICREDRVITGPTPGLTRDSVSVEWTFRDRKFRLVDTAGLTRITPHKQRLTADDKKNVTRIESMLKDTVVLPGIQRMDPESDPSQFSCQVSEFSLVSALNALRFSQVVILMIQGDQGKFSKIDLQLAEKYVSCIYI